MADIKVQHTLEARVKTILDKNSEKELKAELKDLLSDQNIDFNTDEFKKSIQSIGEVFNKVLKQLGQQTIDIGQMIQMPGADAWKELGRIAASDFMSGWSASIGNQMSVSVNELKNELNSLKTQKDELENKIEQKKNASKRYSRLSELGYAETKEDIKNIKLPELKIKDGNIKDVAQQLQDEFTEAENKIFDLNKELSNLDKGSDAYTAKIKERNSAMINLALSAEKLYKMQRLLNDSSVEIDPSIREMYSDDSLWESAGKALRDSAKFMDRMWDNADLLAEKFTAQLDKIEIKIKDLTLKIQQNQPEIISEKTVKTTEEKLKMLEEAITRIKYDNGSLRKGSQKNFADESKSHIENAINYNAGEKRGRVSVLGDKYIEAKDNNDSWELQYQLLIKFVKEYEAYVAKVGENPTDIYAKDIIKNYSGLYSELKPLIGEATNMLQNVVNTIEGKPLVGMGGNDANGNDVVNNYSTANNDERPVKEEGNATKEKADQEKAANDEAEKTKKALEGQVEANKEITEASKLKAEAEASAADSVKKMATEMQSIKGAEAGTFLNSKTGDYLPIQKGDTDSVLLTRQDYKNATSNGYDTRVHKHNFDVAAPSVIGEKSDTQNWLDTFELVKKQMIVANKEILSFDFSSLTRETLDNIVQAYKKLAEPIDTKYDNLSYKEMADMGGVKGVDESLQAELRNALESVMKNYIGVTTSIPLPDIKTQVEDLNKQTSEKNIAENGIKSKIDLLHQLAIAYQECYDAEDKYNNAETDKQSEKFEQIWEQKKEAVNDLAQEYYAVITTMQDGSVITLELDDTDFAENIQKVLENSKQIQDIKMVPRSAEDAVNAYEHIENIIKNIGQSDLSKLERFIGSVRNPSGMADRLQNELDKITTKDPNFEYGSQEAYNNAVNVIAKLRELQKRTDLTEQAGGLIPDGNAEQFEDQYIAMLKAIREGTVTTVDECKSQFESLFKTIESPVQSNTDNGIESNQNVGRVNSGSVDEEALRLAQEKAEAERLSAEEKEKQLRLAEEARVKAEEEAQLAKEKAEAERKASEEKEAQNIAAQEAMAKAEEEARLAKEKVEAERIAKEEVSKLAQEQAEQARIASEKAANLQQALANAPSNADAPWAREDTLSNGIKPILEQIQNNTANNNDKTPEDNALKNILDNIVYNVKVVENAQQDVNKQETVISQDVINQITSALNNIHVTGDFTTEGLAQQDTVSSIAEAVSSINNKIVQGTKIVEKGNASEKAEPTPVVTYAALSKSQATGVNKDSWQNEFASNIPSGGISDLLAEKIRTAALELVKYYTHIIDAKRYTEDFNESANTLANSLRNVGDNESLAIWKQQFQQLQKTMDIAKNMESINSVDAVESEKARYEYLKEYFSLQEELAKVQKNPEYEQYLQERLNLLGQIQNGEAAITVTEQDSERIEKLRVKHAQTMAKLQGSQNYKDSEASIKQRQAEEDAAWELYRAEQEAEAKKQEEIRKSWEIREAEIAKEQAAIDEATKKQIEDYDKVEAAKQEKDAKAEASTLKQLEPIYKNIGKLEAQATILSGEQLTAVQNQIAYLRGIADEKQKNVSLDKQLLQNIEDQAKAAETLNLKKKEANADVRKSRQAAKFGRVNTVIEKTDTLDRRLNSLREDDVGVDANTKVQQYIKSLENLKQLSDKLSNQQGPISPDDAKVLNTTRQETEELRKEVEKLVDAYKEPVEINGQDQFIKENGTSYKKQLADIAMQLSNGKAKIGEFNAETNTLTYSVKTGTKEMTYYTLSVQDLDKSVAQTTKSVKPLEGLIDAVSRKTKEIALYFAGSFSINRVIQELRKGIQYVREIDSALTELKKVTDETEETYDRFLKTASKTASEVGSTIKEVVSSAADFARLGYSLQEATELAKNAQILMNVSEYSDISSATDALISALKAFNYETSESLHVIDIFNTIEIPVLLS